MSHTPDYEKMYAILCGAIADSIDLLAENRVIAAAALLQQALLNAEDIAING